MRTREELADRLGEERIWRVKEITAVKTLAARPSLAGVERDFYCRAGSALFYAHWEGFVKRAATYYLKFVAMQRLRVDEMADFVTCWYMKQSLTPDPRSDHLLKLGHTLSGQPEMRPKLSWKGLIRTDSNLSSVVLKRITEQLGLDYNLFATKAAFIDGVMLKHRNAIAHGEKGEVDAQTLEEIGTQVTALITTFRDAIENEAVLEKFRR